VDVINWMVSLQRLILGAQGAEFSARASSLDEILTPTNFNLKACSTQGSAGVAPVKIDQNVIFVDRSKARVYQLSFTPQQADYNSEDLTIIVPDLGAVGIARLAVQRKPDTRIHAVLTDGTVMMGLTDPNENVLAWFTLNTDGSVEDVVVLPAAAGTTDDQVYYVVKRTINGSTVRYLEKWAQENVCTGGTLTYLADGYVSYSGSATTVITGLDHLEGEDVVVWADGEDVGTDTDGTLLYTVSSGQITLATAASNVVVGLRYTAQFQSTKLAYVNQGGGSQLSEQKRINHIGLVLADTHSQGLQYGTDFTSLRDLPQLEQGVQVSGVHTAYEEQPIEFDGTWSVDSRLCLQARAPRPATVLAAIIDMEAN